MAKAERGDGGRFVRSGYGEDERYELVRVVALEARADCPTALSMAQFNAAAPAIAAKKGWPKPPTAQAIYASLGKPWPTIVAEAVDPSRNVQQTRAANERSEPAAHADERYLYYSLRRVAREIGEDFSDDQYDLAAAALKKKHERHPGNELPLILLTSGQILYLADGDWNKARALAGLPPRKKATGSTPASPPEKLIEHYFETNDAKPTVPKARAHAKSLGIAFPALGGNNPSWAQHLENTRKARAARGLAFDDSGPRDNERLTPEQIDALVANATPAKHWGKWKNKQNVVDGLCDYVAAYDLSDDLRQGHYVAVFAGRGWPPLKAITAHYKQFQKAITAARKELRRQQRADVGHADERAA